MKVRLTVVASLVGLLIGCSSAEVDSPATTESPLKQEVENLREQVDELKAQLNATTVPTTTTTTTLPATTTTEKPAVKVVEIMRYFDGYTRGFGSQTEHQCREIIKYSDGTEFDSRSWKRTGQDVFGNYTKRDC